jgi:ABC-type transport system substrate-binding protein
MFLDPTVRKAFVEAFDRCTAVRNLLGISRCDDPNLFTDELTTPSSPDYDPSFKLPAYNPTDAAALLGNASYHVVDGIRRGRDGKTPLELLLSLTGTGVANSKLAFSMQHDYRQNLQVDVTIVSVGASAVGYVNELGNAKIGNFDFLLSGQGFLPDPVRNFSFYDSADINSAQNPFGNNTFGIVDAHLTQQDRVGSMTQDYRQRIGSITISSSTLPSSSTSSRCTWNQT